MEPSSLQSHLHAYCCKNCGKRFGTTRALSGHYASDASGGCSEWWLHQKALRLRQYRALLTTTGDIATASEAFPEHQLPDFQAASIETSHNGLDLSNALGASSSLSSHNDTFSNHGKQTESRLDLPLPSSITLNPNPLPNKDLDQEVDPFLYDDGDGISTGSLDDEDITDYNIPLHFPSDLFESSENNDLGAPVQTSADSPNASTIFRVEETEVDAGSVFDAGSEFQTPWERRYAAEDRSRPWYPWASEAEFRLVEFLLRSQLSQSLIDEFLQLDFVSSELVHRLHCQEVSLTQSSKMQKWKSPPSFSSAKEMNESVRKKMTSSAPPFESATVTLRDAPTEPQPFYYRHITHLVDWLFGRPDLADCMDYVPCKIFKNGTLGDERVFHEMSSANLWNEVQVSMTVRCWLIPTLMHLLLH